MTEPSSSARVTEPPISRRRNFGMYHPLTVYTFHCGRCGAALEGEFGPLWFSGEYPVEDTDAFDEDGWDAVADTWVCAKCWHWCEKADDGSEKGLGPQEGCCNGL